jgi:hypothetical protein
LIIAYKRIEGTIDVSFAKRNIITYSKVWRPLLNSYRPLIGLSSTAFFLVCDGFLFGWLLLGWLFGC